MRLHQLEGPCRNPARTAAVKRRPAVIRVAVPAAFFASAAEPCLAASEFIDTAATVLAVIVIIVVPVVVIALFWLVHVLPEKIAEKRQHPQKDAIHVLCLLSLVFGGLLWPLAWLWAYSKPVLYRMAYGRDRHEDFYAEQALEGEEEATAASVREMLPRLRHDLEELEKRGGLSDELKDIHDRLVKLEARSIPHRMSGGSR
jgi:CBS domain containing-hemolysin-like protein